MTRYISDSPPKKLIHCSLKLPPEIKAFDPFNMYSFPTRFAVVERDAASEPDPGSVRQYDANRFNLFKKLKSKLVHPLMPYSGCIFLSALLIQMNQLSTHTCYIF